MKYSGKFASVAIFAAFGVAAMATADIGPFSSIGQSLRTSGSLTESAIGFAAPTVELEILKLDADSALPAPVAGVYRVKRTKLNAKVTLSESKSGNVTFVLGAKTFGPVVFAAADDDKTEEIDLSSIENLGSTGLKAIVKYDGASPSEINSNAVKIEVDTEGPLLSSVNLVGDPTADVVGVRLRFKDDDQKIDSAELHANYEVERKLASETYVTVAYAPKKGGGSMSINVKGSTVTLPIAGPLVVGEYRVTAKGTLQDLVGNSVGRINVEKGTEPQQGTFSTGIFRPTGEAIDFPEYTQREKLDPDANFNPGDHVETRVVRLYYNRDAHRVAQIINRDIQQWNKAGVNDAREFATGARSEADKARGIREDEEADAVATAEQKKTLERQFTVAQRAAEKAQQRFDRIKESKKQVDDLKAQDPTANKPEIDRLQSELKRETGVIDPPTGDGSTQATLAATAQGKVTNLEAQINQQRQLINAAKKRVANAGRDEQIANRTQFEAEVASGTADPDSYAPADLNSIDPVMQVSISVIGEGVIQLRGPIRGINEIRTMINQIDSPLGQVKVGLFTVQINGEEGDKMDEVAARLEGYIDLSRFLTNQSLQLLRRAVQETAAQAISQSGNQYSQHRQIDRDRKYVYSFFGRDFVDELYEMDSEFLRTENKLLSIHAMDTVSLPQATFLMALAKNSIREQILDRFMELVQTELPVAEYSQRRTAGMLKKSRDISAFRRLISIPGFPKDPERALASYKQKEQQKYCKKAAEIYRFHNLMNFFRADVYNDEIMTPVQREFIRLAQIFKSQMVAEIELKQRVVERALIQDSSGDEESQRSQARDDHGKALKALKEAETQRITQTLTIRSLIRNVLYGPVKENIKSVDKLQQSFINIIKTQEVSDIKKFVGPPDLVKRLKELGGNRNFRILPLGARRPFNVVVSIPVPMRLPNNSVTNDEKVKLLDAGLEDEKAVDGSLWFAGVDIYVDADARDDWRDLLIKVTDVTEEALLALDAVGLSAESRATINTQREYLERLNTDVLLTDAEIQEMTAE